MPLTPAQRTALANDIAANTGVVPNGLGFDGVQVKNVPHSGDGAFAVAAWYKLFPASDFFGNYALVPISVIKAAIKHKNYTPTDVVPSSGATVQVSNDILQHLARSVFAQNFQINVNTLLAASSTFDATNANLVASLKDATNTNMPTGASGANQMGGWSGASGIQTVICRKGTNIEKLLADTSGGTGADNTHAATFTYEGPISDLDVKETWGI